MSDEKPTRNEPWRTQAPDYMVAAIDSICDARDDIRAMHAELSSHKQSLSEREERISDREAVLEDKERSLLAAVTDMKEFANKIYGPDSEMEKLRGEVAGRFENVESSVRLLERRVVDLEKKSA